MGTRGPTDGARVDVENRAGDLAVSILQLMRGVHALGFPVVSAEDAHFPGFPRPEHPAAPDQPDAFPLPQDLKQARLGQHVVVSLVDVDVIRQGHHVTWVAHFQSTQQTVQVVHLRVSAVAVEFLPGGASADGRERVVESGRQAHLVVMAGRGWKASMQGQGAGRAAVVKGEEVQGCAGGRGLCGRWGWNLLLLLGDEEAVELLGDVVRARLDGGRGGSGRRGRGA